MVGISDVRRFAAIDGYKVTIQRGIGKSEIGCLLSHLQIIEAAKFYDLDYVTIYEDDIEFHPDFINLFDMSVVPDNWDMIYLGGNDIKPVIHVNDKISKLTGTFTTHAYMIRNNMFDRLIELLTWAEKQVDLYYCDLHPYINAYGFRPKLAFQRACYSDIQNNFMNYNSIR